MTMDNKQYIAALSKRTGRERRDTETLLQGLARALTHHCGLLDSVALPGFGTFIAVKHEEQLVTDHSSGALMLLPPEVELTFRPGTKLRSRIEETEIENSTLDDAL